MCVLGAVLVIATCTSVSGYMFHPPPPSLSLSLDLSEFQNPGQRRDTLRLLCLLLPTPNRDTLQELLQFLSRVALHSNDIILIDGTEV